MNGHRDPLAKTVKSHDWIKISLNLTICTPLWNVRLRLLIQQDYNIRATTCVIGENCRDYVMINHIKTLIFFDMRRAGVSWYYHVGCVGVHFLCHDHQQNQPLVYDTCCCRSGRRRARQRSLWLNPHRCGHEGPNRSYQPLFVDQIPSHHKPGSRCPSSSVISPSAPQVAMCNVYLSFSWKWRHYDRV